MVEQLNILKFPARRQWLMLVILATQEAKIRKIAVQSQPWLFVRPSLKKPDHKKLGWLSGSR
jgi:hypothetical protein